MTSEETAILAGGALLLLWAVVPHASDYGPIGPVSGTPVGPLAAVVPQGAPAFAAQLPAGLPSAGQLGAIAAVADTQWKISPSSVVGGIVMGPIGTFAGAVRDLVPEKYNPFYGGPNPNRRLTDKQRADYIAQGYSVNVSQRPKGITYYVVKDKQGKVISR